MCSLTLSLYQVQACLTTPKQVFYAALSVLTHRTSPEGFRLLRVIRSYLNLDSWIGLDVHTERTLREMDAELLVFNAALNVSHNLHCRYQQHSPDTL